jgi:hypothetical protein
MAKPVINNEILRSICKNVLHELKEREKKGWAFPCEAEEYNVIGEALEMIREQVRDYLKLIEENGNKRHPLGMNERRISEIIDMVSKHKEGVIHTKFIVNETVNAAVQRWQERCKSKSDRA